MGFFRRLIPCLALAIASCTLATGPQADTSPTVAETVDTTASSPIFEENEVVDAGQFGLPEGYELEVTGTVIRPVPAGTVAVRTVAAVGPSSSDPRVLEYTIFNLDDSSNLDAVTEMVGPFEATDVIELDGGRFAFVSESDRSALDLLDSGPPVNASFRAPLGDDVVAIGGSANLQPAAVEEVLANLSIDQGSDGLPPTMSVLVDGTLPDGRFVELTSVHGSTTVVVYDDIGREWFEYFTWGDPDVPVPEEVAELADDVSLRPVESYGIGGAAEGPVRFSYWRDGSLTVIEQPESVPLDEATEVAALVLDETVFDTLFAKGPQLEPSPSADDQSSPTGPGSRAPTEAEMDVFQQFVETQVGTEHGRPIWFNYVDDFPTDGVRFEFISSELWLVASALGLTDEGQTHGGANQARLDAVRGTPGTIALQPTQTETDVVTVHEMVHVVDFLAPDVASNELFSMSQVISEGNAHRIAYDYLQTLDEVAQEIMEPFPHIFPDGGDPRISRAVQDLLEFPYDEGRLFMAAAATDGDRLRIAQVFQRPPVSTEQVLFFDAWLSDNRPLVVEVPTPPRGTTTLGDGSLGVYLLLLVATEIGRDDEALGALAEWSGDSFILYESGTDICLDTTAVFDSPEATSTIGAILGEAAAEIAIDADTIRATFCG